MNLKQTLNDKKNKIKIVDSPIYTYQYLES